MATNEPRPIREEAAQPQVQIDLYSVIGQKEVENGVLRGQLQQAQQFANALSERLRVLEGEIALLQAGEAAKGVADDGQPADSGVHADVGAEGSDDEAEDPADVAVVEQLEAKAGQ